MSSQFRSRFMFQFLTKIQMENNITWYYSDGHGGTVKNLVCKKVKSGDCIIGTPLQFAQYANETCEFILLHYT